MRLTTTLAPLALALLLGGCASFPQDTPQLPTSSQLAQDQDKKWASLPAVRHVSSGTGMSIRRVAPLPGSLADRQISFHLSAKASLDEIGGALATQGIPVVLKTPTDKASEAIRITNFSGGRLFVRGNRKTIWHWLFAITGDLDSNLIFGLHDHRIFL